jgi:quercetin dioxygenase-like cupin family protein
VAASTRRVVTGKDAAGKAIVISDETVSPHERKEMGIAPTLLWITDSAPARLRTSPVDLPQAGIAPPDRGTVFRIVEIAPESAITTSADARRETMRRMNLAPEGPPREKTHPGMHRTRSVDYALVLSGEIDMLLDDSEVHLKPGDVVIQQATNHAWTNREIEPCRIAFILVDAEP